MGHDNIVDVNTLAGSFRETVVMLVVTIALYCLLRYDLQYPRK